jgi:hypothetical protein
MTNSRTARNRRDSNVYPAGWDYRRARAVADYYDGLKDQTVLDDATVAKVSVRSVWMEIPQELVPAIQKLIARHRKSA